MNEHSQKVHAVDLDRTLAFHHSGMGTRVIGKPIPGMLEQVRDWIAEGDKVVIFTARAGYKGARPAIRKWLRRYGLSALEVTNIKRPEFDDIHDDKAVHVPPNKGPQPKSWDDEAREAMK